ncbi:MAG: sigma-70 family RNA polymerase sigma factor [Candidatus Thermofonsia bacterium]|nr:MAG: sigma-70 family RNA polymerase sigma factor [Candidatus Thermofonsia bacterium]
MANLKEQSLTALSDARLLEGISRGDTASFDTLFHRHYDRVYGLLFRLVGNRDEAEELVQEVFLKLYHEFFGRRTVFARRKEHNISAWLYRVATNTGYNAIRSRKRLWQRNVHLVPDPTGTPDSEAEVARREEETAVRAALARLKPRDAQMLLLRQMGFSYEELAEVCNVAPTSVGKLLSRAADAFRKAYGVNDDE